MQILPATNKHPSAQYLHKLTFQKFIELLHILGVRAKFGIYDDERVADLPVVALRPESQTLFRKEFFLRFEHVYECF